MNLDPLFEEMGRNLQIPARLFLRAGHHRDDPGAVANGQKENELTIALRNDLAQALKARGVVVLVDDDADDLATDVQKIAQQCRPNDILLDLHFNAASPRATGTECLVPLAASRTEVNLANEIAKAAAQCMQIPNRHHYNGGLPKTEAQSHHGRLAIMRPNCHNVLWEVCFLTNAADMAAYAAHHRTLISTLTHTIFPYLHVA
ncbi:MAG: N-acetylmuramoyl-L-alanine amidase [Sphingobacteriia bacterium]